MMDLQRLAFWTAQLSSAENPLVHLVDPGDFDEATVRTTASTLGFEVASVDCSGIYSDAELIAALDRALAFPDWFGRNWNAVSDCLTDLSWLPAKGYVLVFRDARELLRLPTDVIDVFIGVVETAIANWRDERGEHGERSHAIPFHCVFLLTPADGTPLLWRLREPYCIHPSSDSAEAVLVTQAVSRMPEFQNVVRLLAERQPEEVILRYLKERWSHSKRDVAYVLAASKRIPVSVARRHVEDSDLWLEPSWSSRNLGYLVVLLASPLSLANGVGWPIAAFWAQGTTYVDVGLEEWWGFYYWLRSKNGALVGVRFCPERLYPPLVEAMNSLGYARLGPHGELETFFTSDTNYDPDRSDEQLLLYAAIFRSSSGDLALAFDTTALSVEDFEHLSASGVTWAEISVDPGPDPRV